MKRSRFLPPALAGLAWLLTMTSLAAEPRLRSQIVVEGAWVTAGDVFENAGTAAMTRLFAAPRPGGRTVVLARDLARVARRRGIAWRPLGGVNRIVVTRAGQVIDSGRIKDLLKTALRQAGAGENLRIELGAATRRLVIPVGGAPEIAIENIDFRPGGRYFRAVILASIPDQPTVRADVSGRVFAIVEIPVLDRRIRVGTAIVDADISWIEVTAAKVGRGTVTDAPELIGQAPKRPIAPGRPVMARDLTAPHMVRKGAGVTMIVRTRRMLLSAKGRALQSGAKGDTIRILNPRSHRIIEGVVTGVNRITITPLDRLADAGSANLANGASQ